MAFGFSNDEATGDRSKSSFSEGEVEVDYIFIYL